MTWAWGVRELAASKRLVLMCLADHSDNAGVCWPGNAAVAEKCELSERQVMRDIAAFEARGLLSVERRKGPNQKQLFNVITLHLNAKVEDATSRVTPMSPGTGAEPGDVDVTRDRTAPSDTGDTRQSPEPGDILAPSRVTSVSSAVGGKGGVLGEVVITKNRTNTPELSLDLSEKAPEDLERWFNQVFWPRFPNRVAKARAWRAVCRLRPSPPAREAIMAGLDRWVRDRTRREGARLFVPECPYPSTWLNERRWEDETGPGAAPAGPSPRDVCNVCSARAVVFDGKKGWCSRCSSARDVPRETARGGLA